MKFIKIANRVINIDKIALIEIVRPGSGYDASTHAAVSMDGVPRILLNASEYKELLSALEIEDAPLKPALDAKLAPKGDS